MSYIKIELHQATKTRYLYYSPAVRDRKLAAKETWEPFWFKDEHFKDALFTPRLPLPEQGEYKISLFVNNLEYDDALIMNVSGPHAAATGSYKISPTLTKAQFSVCNLLHGGNEFSIQFTSRRPDVGTVFSYRAVAIVYELIT